MSRTINLKAEMAESGYGLRFDVGMSQTVAMHTGDVSPAWVLRVFRVDQTQDGRPRAHPNPLLVLIAKSDEGPAVLLRNAADYYEAGDFKVL